MMDECDLWAKGQVHKVMTSNKGHTLDNMQGSVGFLWELYGHKEFRSLGINPKYQHNLDRLDLTFFSSISLHTSRNNWI